MAPLSELAKVAPRALDNRGPEVGGVAIGFLIVAIISYALRIYVRVFMMRGFGWDDWFMTAAAITFTFYISCVLGGVHYGTGQHFAALTETEIQRAMEFWFFCYIGYCWTMILSKISIGLFLVRIIVKKITLHVIYLAMFLSVVTGLIFFFVAVLQCTPVSYFWNKTQPGSCISVDIIIDMTFLYTALNIVCDFSFALMPIFIIRNLNMPKRMKMATIPLLSMGCLASGGAVVRMAYVERFRDADFLYDTVDIAIWSTVEAGLAITAGSLACVRPLFKLLLHQLGLTGSGELYPVGSSNPDAVRLANHRQQRLEPHLQTIGGRRSRHIDVFTLHTIRSARDIDGDGESFRSHGESNEDDITKMRTAVLSSEEENNKTAKGGNPGLWGTKPPSAQDGNNNRSSARLSMGWSGATGS